MTRPGPVLHFLCGKLASGKGATELRSERAIQAVADRRAFHLQDGAPTARSEGGHHHHYLAMGHFEG